MSEYDRAPREYRSPPLSDIQQAIPERKAWTRDAPVVPDEKAAFGRGFLWGVIASLISSGALTVLWYLLAVQPPGAY